MGNDLRIFLLTCTLLFSEMGNTPPAINMMGCWTCCKKILRVDLYLMLESIQFDWANRLDSSMQSLASKSQ